MGVAAVHAGALAVGTASEAGRCTPQCAHAPWTAACGRMALPPHRWAAPVPRGLGGEQPHHEGHDGDHEQVFHRLRHLRPSITSNTKRDPTGQQQQHGPHRASAWPCGRAIRASDVRRAVRQTRPSPSARRRSCDSAPLRRGRQAEHHGAASARQSQPRRTERQAFEPQQRQPSPACQRHAAASDARSNPAWWHAAPRRRAIRRTPRPAPSAAVRSRGRLAQLAREQPGHRQCHRPKQGQCAAHARQGHEPALDRMHRDDQPGRERQHRPEPQSHAAWREPAHRCPVPARPHAAANRRQGDGRHALHATPRAPAIRVAQHPATAKAMARHRRWPPMRRGRTIESSETVYFRFRPAQHARHPGARRWPPPSPTACRASSRRCAAKPASPKPTCRTCCARCAWPVARGRRGLAGGA